MTLSELSIRRPVFAWMLMAGLIIFGWISFTRMGISMMPDVDFAVVSVSVGYEGAAPEVVESSVVDILEDAVTSVQGVKSISSYSRYGSASLTVEFELGRNIDSALQEVQTKIAQAQRMLPKEIDTPIITKSNPEDQPILWMSLSSTRHSTVELMKYTRDQIKDKFTTVPGAGEVFLGGYVEPNLRIWISNKDLNKFDLAVGDVLTTIQNEHSELPAGQIETGRREVDVRTMGEARSIQEFSDIVINQRGGAPNYRPIYLKQIARVEEGTAEVRRLSRFKGTPAVGLGIRKQRGSNAVEVAKAVKIRLGEVQKNLPEGMTLNVNFDTTKFIEEAVGELNFTLILSAILTGFVCWLFLGSWSSTFNVLLAIPTSIIGAFIFLYFAGFTLNTFTLLGLSLAIGVVVDDAIMVLENIVRHRELGQSRFKAALTGSREITFAAVAATIAIVAIFLPVAFMRGVIGKFFFQFGVTMTVTVMLSLLEALTLTPMRCSQFVDSGEHTTWIGKKTSRVLKTVTALYKSLLAVALDHRWKVILASLVFFAVSFWTVTKLNKEFVPAQDQSLFMIRFQAPVDSSLAYTDSKFKEIEAYLATRPEVEKYFGAIGGMGGAGDVSSGMAFVTLIPKNKRKVTQQQFMEIARKDLAGVKDVKIFMQDLSKAGFSSSRGFPVEFTIRGPDWDKLAESSKNIIAELEKTGMLTDLDSDYKLGKPEFRITPNRMNAALRGVSIRAISETVNALVGGTVRGKYQSGGHRYDIRVRLLPEERDRAEAIKSLYVRNNRNELVQLSEVVKIEERASLQQIIRYDRERAITVFANVKNGQSQAKALEAVQTIGKKILPEGYRVVMSGSAETMKQSFTDLTTALVLGILVAYMVLASQFNSFIDPFTVLMALPFSISGAFVALLLTGQSLNIYSFIGLILLMGIVKKNSILLVEFTNQKRDGGIRDVREALLVACPIRLRPIMMTSFATIAAAIPPAMAIGPGAETRIPMSVAVIGGVLVSTFLTLFVIPCVYSLFAKFDRRSRGVNPEEEESPVAVEHV
ncbi:MAG TPA: AcrB/AcrD/AcrF family protein [Bdellovibrionales bacterium]|nr:MAG: acriflavin resistance protein [Bdellovibrionales bacterium GWB1_52_6]OFZ04282.1 MAG: acriflavin resistance protein [Bdellovibrionales bacterium GWA1_52_35]OFZ43533.1 MAG: acriflavin resistance protein [Bdellovibrionales bacterium GWC1_52_8]HAR43955.1 AcrB/AcrD/AcrF family protein [Bdellovibrionales bacterium]HCM40871.1 AcrB/AcrD/AcrF family protein [Bdellovibrionales bacterium]